MPITAEQYNSLRGQGMSPQQIIRQVQSGTTHSGNVGIMTQGSPQASEVPQPDNFLTKLGNIGNAIFGGGRIGEAIGNFANKQTPQYQQLEKLNPNLISGLSQGPTTGQLAGDIAKVGLTVGVPALGKALTGGGLLANIAKGAGIGGAFGAANSAADTGQIQPGSVATGALVGGALPIAGYAIGKVGNYIANRLPKMLGIISGENAGTIENALKDPSAADIGLQNGDEALRNAAQEGSSKSINLRNKFIQAHSQAFQQLAGENADALTSKKEIINGLKEILDNKDVNITKQGLDFTTSKIAANPGEAGKIQTAFQMVKGWNDWSLDGVNTLKQNIGQLTRFPLEGGGVSKSPALGSFYHFLDTAIKENLPEDSRAAYTSLNAKFNNQIPLYNDMVDAFNSGDPFKRLANSLSDNNDTIRQTLKLYEKESGKNILSTVAGRNLGQEKTSGGLLGTGLGFRNFLDLLVSPKFQGKLVLGAGRLSNNAHQVSSPILSQATPLNRTLVKNLFLSLLGHR